ncbi:MAG TPA: HIT family protein [Candidatus Pacearchaeota archaeon]|nr:HIT family protein [Candidatus Pacearchaeota archaeon]
MDASRNSVPSLCGDSKNLDIQRACVFCKIVRGELPCHKIWEDDKHLAFLSIFPNTEGFSVVITKEHLSSYVFDLPEDVLKELVVASKKVGLLIDSKLDDVGRTGMMFEGFGVDHAHAKLFPMHGTADMGKWKQQVSPTNKYFDKYEGYISSHDSERADDEALAELAGKIRD